ncbi:hypothetical protein IM33_20200 [Clostridioides difficile]|nr:hypothetical protein IM33_20200 [Clostridioides difficile]
MKLEMIDSAIHSLKLVKEYFRDYRNKDCKDKKDNTSLELSIVFLYNSIELLIQSILMNKNELLIYEDLSQNKLDECIKSIKLSLNPNLLLAKTLIKKEGIKTYTDLITTYCNIFDVNESTQTVLTNLGKLRDTVFCFGIKESDDFNYILLITYKSMNIILDVLNEELEKIDDCFKSDDIRDILEPLVEDFNNIFAPIQ